MRCAACNNVLTDREASRKFLYSGKYTDLCSICLDTISDVAPTQDDSFRGNESKDIDKGLDDANSDVDETLFGLGQRDVGNLSVDGG